MRLALNADDTGRQPVSCAALELSAMTEAELDGSVEIVRTVIPPPGEGGELPTRDGRRQLVSDPAALAAALNAQDVDVRIDFDHQSERSSRTFRGSTAAEGWARNFRAAANGAVEAVLELSGWARHEIRSGRYKYLSPAVWRNKETDEVMGMSSLALVNDPNMVLEANNNDGAAAAAEPGLDERERRVGDREKAAERLMMSAAERSVDAAIESKRLAPAQKDFVLNAIRTHGEGIEKGIVAFEAAYPAAADTSASPALNSLDRRVAPAGAPATTEAPAARFRGPQGVPVDEEGLQLHARVAAHAWDRNVSYRQAVMELGALQQ